MDVQGVFRSKEKEASFDELKPSNISETKLSRPLYTTQHSSGGMDIMFWIAVEASQLVGISFVVLVWYWSSLYGGFAWYSDADLQFNCHPPLMILGLVFFYGDAILVYRVLSFLPKSILKLIHASLHLSAIVCSSVGLAAAFENHRRTERAHLYSLHSWVGLSTFAFFCVQFVASFVTFLFPGMPLRVRAQMMPFHIFFGIGIFLMAVASALMGLTEKLLWTSEYTSGNFTLPGTIGNSIGVHLVVFAFLIVFLASYSKYKRKPLPSEIVTTTN